MSEKLKKNLTTKLVSIEHNSGILSTKILLAVFQIAYWFIGHLSDSLFILLVVGFDDLFYR